MYIWSCLPSFGNFYFIKCTYGYIYTDVHWPHQRLFDWLFGVLRRTCSISAIHDGDHLLKILGLEVLKFPWRLWRGCSSSKSRGTLSYPCHGAPFTVPWSPTTSIERLRSATCTCMCTGIRRITEISWVLLHQFLPLQDHNVWSGVYTFVLTCSS